MRPVFAAPFQWASVLLLLLAGASAAGAEDHGAMPYRQIADALQLKELAGSTAKVAPLLQFKLRLTPKDLRIDPASLELRALVEGKERIFPANRFGAFELPLTLSMYESNPLVHVNRGFARGLTMGVDLRIRGEFGQTVALEVVELAQKQYDQAIHSAGWKFRLFAPRLDRVVLRIPPRATGCRIETPANVASPVEASAAGEVRVSLKRLRSLSATELTCDALIEEVLLEAA